jgi:hypothetical protein
MTDGQLNLLEALDQTDEYSSAILGTFSLGGEFLESEVLPRLRSLGIRNTIVLTDREEYHETDNLTQAGNQYYLDHIRCPQTFHPKFVLLLGHRRGYCLVGSANLTAAGWQHNAELMTEFKYVDRDSDTTTEAVFGRIIDFIDGISATGRLPSTKTQTAIEEAMCDAPWLEDTSPVDDGTNVTLLDNLSTPLLEQVSDRIPQQAVDEITVVSPFFSGEEMQVIQSLCMFDPDRLVLNIQPDRVQGFDATAVVDAVPDSTDLIVQTLTVGEDENRYLHAKSLLLRGTEEVWALYGSANLTTSALALPATAGNIELGVLRHESQADYFGYLFDDSVVDQSVIDPTSVSYEPYDTEDDEPSEETIHLSAAHLETDGSLVLGVEELPAESITVHLRNPQAGSTLHLSMSAAKTVDGTLNITDERIPNFCDGATKVQLTIHLEDEDQRTDARWIARPSLEVTPRTSEVKQIEASNGRNGLVELLNRLEGIHAMYDFLDEFEFGRGDITIHPDGSGGGGSSGDGDDLGGEGMEERTVSESTDVFKNKLEAFQTNLDSATGEPGSDETWQSQFRDVLDIFLGGSKFTFWWVARDSSASLNLRYVRFGMKDLKEFVKRTRAREGTEIVQEFEREQRLLEHVAIVAYYLDQLLQRTRNIDGADAKVYDIFQDTIRAVLQTCAANRSDSFPSDEALAECLDEYGELKIRTPSARRIQAFCRQFLDDD